LNRWRYFLIPIALLCLKPAFAPAQHVSPEKKAPVANAQAEARGLLLGIYFPNAASWYDLTSSSASDDKWVPEISAKPHGHYLTLWISRRGGTLKIQPIDGLLVPRVTGFWHIGTHIVKSDQDPQSNYDEQFWAVPVEQEPKRPGTDAQIDGASVRLITYVGSEYLSYLSHWQGGAGDWEYANPHVSSLDNLAKDRSIEQVLGSAEEAQYKRLAKSLDHMNEEPKNGEDREPCNCCSGVQNEWGIMHQGDSWKPYARFHYGTSSSCSQQSLDRLLNGMLPRNVVWR
jgi:hypothetical protein